MKISYRWLQDFLDLDMLGIDPSEIARSLTMIGLAVEGIDALENDTVFDIDVTTNRPDCLNHLGVARELAAQFRLPLEKPDTTAPAIAPSEREFPIEISILEPELCPRYSGRVLTGVQIAESPDWLKARLESVGQRPINNIVDITNYVLFELGHPLHAFDYEKLMDRRIVVRRAENGELIRTLDGVQRELDDTVLMICDSERPVALAGIMGGEETEISDQTVTILLESAFFNPASISASARKLGLRTEASYRFERRADPEMPVLALNMACRMIAEIAGGEAVSRVVDENPIRYEDRPFRLRLSRIRQVVGIDVSSENVRGILEGLEFQPQPRGDQIDVVIPSFRGDVEVEDDLVEEVARHYGYDRIPSRYPPSTSIGHYARSEAHDRILISTLIGAGFFEAINYSFSTPQKEAVFLGDSPEMIPIANPLSEMGSHLRTILLPGLVESLRQNLNVGNRDIRLFELGTVFAPGSGNSLKERSEVRHLALVATGDFYSPFWNQQSERFGFYHLKGLLESLFQNLGAKVEVEPARDIPYLHPGVSSFLTLEGAKVGVLGEMHPSLRDTLKFPERVYLAEFSLEKIYAQPLRQPSYQSLGRFPTVERDLSFLLDRDTPFSKIQLAVRALSVSELKEFRLIDLYQGQNLPQGKLSLTVRFTFGRATGNLTQDEVAEIYSRIVDSLKSQFAIEPR